MICKNCRGSGAVVLGAHEAPPESGLDAIYEYGPCPDCDGRPFVLTDIPLIQDLIDYFDGVTISSRNDVVLAMAEKGHSGSSIGLALESMYHDGLIGIGYGNGLPHKKEEDAYEPPFPATTE